ncbi:CMRF35-like molecule 3 isoform X2 [Oreochromis aureus]|uniref:CMRF35-like molecule 3 isoform X2 n=1 Tax=Oreochromis aureus TaxID=47969 RepID=UPI0019533E44|nr:CMRF35-like molecule 3 isoform X2 [Oreochromis aureus]
MKINSLLYCLLYAGTLTDGTIINIEEFEGRSVSFQCSHTLAWSNNKYFCKDPCTSTGDVLLTVEPGRRAESGRIALVDSGDGSFTVTFSHLQLSDSQKYWCGVGRPGFDTYVEVHLTVKKAVKIVTTVVPDVSSTWTYRNTNTTHLTTGIDTTEPTKLSTALNFTAEEGPNINTGTIVYATVGGVGLIAIVLLAVCCRKSRKTSKIKQHVYCNSADFTNANERKVSCGYDDTEKRTKCRKKSPKSSYVPTHQQRQDLPTSDPPASVHLHIYENISSPKLPECSGYSPTGEQNDYDNNSGIYINTLPNLMHERTDHGTCRKHKGKHKTCKNTESCTNSVSRAPCGSTEEKPRSLWFGLDLSEIKES